MTNMTIPKNTPKLTTNHMHILLNMSIFASVTVDVCVDLYTIMCIGVFVYRLTA